jgi:predicted transcriptional regulator
MEHMNTQSDKKELIEWISNLTDPKTLEKIKTIKTAIESDTDFWQDLPAEVKQSINKGIRELDNGRGIPHDQVMKEIRRITLHPDQKSAHSNSGAGRGSKRTDQRKRFSS